MAEQPPNPPEIPSFEELNGELPQYDVIECVGVGGMGGVYKAHQENLDRFVAIKVLARGIGDEEFTGHFKSEAQAMARLNQTNIISVYDFGLTGGGWLYFVMEFVDGKTLFDLIHENLIDRAAAVATITQVCGALQYAHEHGVVHRDIKSANILVDGDGHAKVGDFGLAKLYADEGARGLGDSSYGTPDYAAPEVLDPNSEIDHRADIYSLGALFFELLTGHTPNADRKPTTGTDFDVAIQKAMAPDPDKRYQTASEFRKVIETVWSASTGNPEINESPKGKGTLILGAAAGIALLSAIVAFTVKGKDGDNESGKKPPIVKKEGSGNSKIDEPPKVASTNNGKGDETLANIFENGAIEPAPPKEKNPDESPQKDSGDGGPKVVDKNPGGDPKIDLPPIEPEPKIPKEPTEADKRMQPILEPFYSRFESSVVKPFEDGLANLRSKYLEALEPVEADLKEAGDPSGLIKVREEMNRLSTNEEIPDGLSGIEALDARRRTYHANLNKLIADRDNKAGRLITGLQGLLEELESELTRATELDIAVEVRDYRTKVKDQILRQYFPEPGGEAGDAGDAGDARPPGNGSAAEGSSSDLLPDKVWKQRKPPHFLIQFFPNGNVRYLTGNGEGNPWEQGNPTWEPREGGARISFDNKQYPVGGGEMRVENITEDSINLRNPNRKMGGIYTGSYDRQ